MPPLTGFGIVGWVASAVLIAMLVALALGVDFQARFIQLIAALVGIDGMFAYVARIHVWHSLSLNDPTFNLISMIYVIIALFIAGRLRWWSLLLVIVWAFIRPLHLLHRCVIVLGIDFGLPHFDMTGNRWSTGEICSLLTELVTCLLILILTRSWRVTVSVLLLVILANVMIYFAILVNWTPRVPALARFLQPTTIVWHLSLAISLLVWAVHTRKRTIGHCASCGYDLRGVMHERCPECGYTGSTKSVVTSHTARA